ncbi:Sec-dependent nitrous-oxide reductase [Bacteroidetes/Chlorobi group bacterium Naka2016]|jgi:nitrous-oxide reductase|nr:MAG: Sec-dependent nitrous-oxide reductase [Bacteroidetes/Chlorobi group bacterium Naka2016]
MKSKALLIFSTLAVATIVLLFFGCPSGKKSVVEGDAAQKVYVAPGQYDEFYAFMSGGFSGQLSVYGIPSGRCLRIVPVFAQYPENGYGYSEETKAMLNTSYGFIPWDDSHHPELSQTNGEIDGRWLFINANNVPRIARVDLSTFRTVEIIEIPNSAGNHPSAFVTENTEYVVAGTRFSVPIPQEDITLQEFKNKMKGTISFIKVDPQTGRMNIEFQILMPGFNYDLSHPGRGKSHGWYFFSCYNSEQATSMLEVNASQNDKDFIAAINWKKAEEYLKQGKYKEIPGVHYHNIYDEKKHMAYSEINDKVKVLIPQECPGLVYYIPTPKSPHGCDVDPTGEYIVGGGKLATVIPVYSFTKMIKAIEEKKFDKEIDGIPVLNYEAVLHGEVQNPGLGPLHTEFDGKGYAYTSCFVSSEVTKWSLQDCKVVDRIPVYYSIGHLCIAGGDSKKPIAKYLLALNKITKDRYLPTGPELAQSCQLIDISGEKMKMLYDFPTLGEPHYAQMAPASVIKDKQAKIFKLEENQHQYRTISPDQAKVVREGNKVHIYMTAIRSHFTPDNIEGIKVGDEVYFHVTNLEQDWDIPHGFAVMGSDNAEILVMPGETLTLKWKPTKPGIYPFYCTDFCSALHQEMQGYVRVSPANANVQLSWNK